MKAKLHKDGAVTLDGNNVIGYWRFRKDSYEFSTRKLSIAVIREANKVKFRELVNAYFELEVE